MSRPSVRVRQVAFTLFLILPASTQEFLCDISFMLFPLQFQTIFENIPGRRHTAEICSHRREIVYIPKRPWSAMSLSDPSKKLPETSHGRGRACLTGSSRNTLLEPIFTSLACGIFLECSSRDAAASTGLTHSTGTHFKFHPQAANYFPSGGQFVAFS